MQTDPSMSSLAQQLIVSVIQLTEAFETIYNSKKSDFSILVESQKANVAMYNEAMMGAGMYLNLYYTCTVLIIHAHKPYRLKMLKTTNQPQPVYILSSLKAKFKLELRSLKPQENI